MVDANRPAAFDIRDTATGTTVDRVTTHDDALRVCHGLEPEQSPEGWRYIIEPVREAHQ